jgi:hypothetical protein
MTKKIPVEMYGEKTAWRAKISKVQQRLKGKLSINI